jgi:hypothetical protein
VDAACRVLRAVLDAGLAREQALLVSEALELLDACPPVALTGVLPHAGQDPADPRDGLSLAMGYLERAVRRGASIREVCRYASAACLLTPALRDGSS